MKTKKKNNENKLAIEKPPVVVVMGHIDHGKTTLLDAIRKTNVVDKEHGGITQHVSAYEIEHNGKKLTFLDTPGHEAFNKMRIRGANVADIVILVIAADDGVKPQTLEALSAIKESNVPYIVALNKTDRKESDSDKVKKMLSEHEVFIEEWGGKVPLVEVSAKEGTNIEELLDMIILVAEMEELVADPTLSASGVIIESHIDKRRGNSATLLILNGTLHIGDYVSAGSSVTKVRILEDAEGHQIREASFSMPVHVVGFDNVPIAGDEFISFTDKKEMDKTIKECEKDVENNVEENEENMENEENEEKEIIIPVLIKADVSGSYEALQDSLERIKFKGGKLMFIGGGVGDVLESDVKAIAREKDISDSIIIAFGVKITPEARAVSERFNVKIEVFDIIYEAIEWVEKSAKEIIPKKIIKEETGKLAVLKVFKKENSYTIAGGKVIGGHIDSGLKFDLSRNEKVIATGTIGTVEADKQKVNSVGKGSLCGLTLNTEKSISEGDEIIAFKEVEDN